MPARTVVRYYRADLRQHRDWLFVFGDNLERRGFGGQAKEARGEPNAVGIPTKATPTTYGYLNDADFDRWLKASIPAFWRIAKAMDDGLVVVWPEDGIGTGRARLKQMAPRIWRELQARIATLEGPSKL